MKTRAAVSDENVPWNEKQRMLKHFLCYYSLGVEKISLLRWPFLLAVRLYWGWQFVQTGWGKLHHITRTAGFFMSLNIPFPATSAYLASGMELFGGLLLILGLASRLTGLLLAFDMLVAYWTADHGALVSIFSDPGKFYAADPYTFLFASLMVLILGAGLFSVDALIAKRFSRLTTIAP
jgi:putative oxidoreductase